MKTVAEIYAIRKDNILSIAPSSVSCDSKIYECSRNRNMKGRVLDYEVQSNSGVISGDDGGRYAFSGSDWKAVVAPRKGMAVDYDVKGTNAIGVYPALESSDSKSKVAAGLFAILLGGLGIHKFYLGYIGPGLVYLLTNTIGWFLTIFMLGIPNFILFVFAFVEGVIYLTKTDEEFERIYVVGRRSWF